MIRHFLTLVWNKKRQYIPLILQLFIAYLATSFLVLFIMNTALYEYKTINFDTRNLKAISEQQVQSTSVSIRRSALALKEVENLSFTNYVPYKNTTLPDTIRYGEQAIKLNKWFADEFLYSTLKLSMREGRWFDTKDKNGMKLSIIINEYLKDQLFNKGTAIGRTVKMGNNDYTVIGVVKDLNDPSNNYGQAFEFNLNNSNSFLIKLREPFSKESANTLVSALTDKPTEFTETITPIDKYVKEFNSRNNLNTFIIFSVALFIIINVILGLFSLLYQNINRRKPEIGVRKAIGATKRHINNQFLFETILITTIAIVPGIIICYQFMIFRVFDPNDLNCYYSMLIAAFIIYTLVILCTLYPAYLASRIDPANSLHEE